MLKCYKHPKGRKAQVNPEGTAHRKRVVGVTVHLRQFQSKILKVPPGFFLVPTVKCERAGVAGRS